MRRDKLESVKKLVFDLVVALKSMCGVALVRWRISVSGELLAEVMAKIIRRCGRRMR
jgi:hypothetical protein